MLPYGAKLFPPGKHVWTYHNLVRSHSQVQSSTVPPPAFVQDGVYYRVLQDMQSTYRQVRAATTNKSAEYFLSKSVNCLLFMPIKISRAYLQSTGFVQPTA